MFFPRLRRRAKWVFVVLALSFAIGFVAFGVGAGGSGIGDYISDLLNRQPSGAGGSIEKARERLDKNPNDAEAQLDLADALQADGRTDEAITALERYVQLRPKNADALQQLASLYLIKAGEAEESARAAQVESQQAFFGDELRSPTGPLALGLGQEPITAAIRQSTSQRYQEAFSAAQAAYRKEADVWKKLTALRPDDANFFLELGRSSQQAGDAPSAVVAYNRYLELSPDATNAPQIRALIKQLEAQSSAATGGG